VLQVKQTFPQFVRGHVGEVEGGLNRGAQLRDDLIEWAWTACNGDFGFGSRLRLLGGSFGFGHGPNTTRSAPLFR